MSEISVTATRRTINKIVSYAQAAYSEHKCEIGGMAVCVKGDDNEWKIENPVILKQDITGTNCSLDQTELAKYYVNTNANKKYKNKDYRFLWWHSHHMMDAFWSGTDLNAIDEFKDGDLSFALVVNLKGKYLVRASAWLLGMHQDMELDVLESDNKVSQKILDEVNDKCETKSYTKSTWANKSYIPGHANKNQTTVFELSDGAILTEPVSEEEEAFTNKWLEVYEEIEEIISDTVKGVTTIKAMKENFALMNGILSKEKFPIRIDYEDLNTLDRLMTVQPYDIMENDKKFDKIVTELVTIQVDYYAYNWSYGVGRRYQ